MTHHNGLLTGADGKVRCWWCGDDPLYMCYHDTEWGRVQSDDIRLFEKLCLEGFQAGLSWITVLRKRENFRAVFDGFDFRKVALYDEKDVARLLKDEGIIRHRGKIEAVINNAQKMIDLIDEFGSFKVYLDQNVSLKKKDKSKSVTYENMPLLSQSEEAKVLSKDLKKRGFSFVGQTTVYSFMQAMGLVNDHIEGCFVREAYENLVD